MLSHSESEKNSVSGTVNRSVTGHLAACIYKIMKVIAPICDLALDSILNVIHSNGYYSTDIAWINWIHLDSS